MSNAARLEFHSRGGGVVECEVRCRGDLIGGFALAYPQQGQMIGSPPVDVAIARKLNAAVIALNAELEACAS